MASCLKSTAQIVPSSLRRSTRRRTSFFRGLLLAGSKMIVEPCPACVKDVAELVLAPGENSSPLRLIDCDNCGGSGLVPHGHENAGDSEMC